MNQIHERRRAAVHDRHFRRVQLDDDVVDADAHERREEMFDRLNRHFVARERGGKLNPRQMLHACGHFVIADVGAPKPHTEIRRRRLQCELHLVARVKTDSNA